MAVSIDSREDTKALVEKLELTFPVAYALDFMEFATKTGAYYETRRSIIHATGFIIRPSGKVVHAVYSSGPIGRFQAIDCLRSIDFINRQTT